MRVYPKWKLGAPSLYISPLTLAVSKLRFRLRLACMELPTIRHLRWRFWVAWGKLLHPSSETGIFRELVGSHPLHAKACPYLWAGIVWGCVLNERGVNS